MKRWQNYSTNFVKKTSQEQTSIVKQISDKQNFKQNFFCNVFRDAAAGKVEFGKYNGNVNEDAFIKQ